MITVELNKLRNITYVPKETCAFLYDYGQKIQIISQYGWPSNLEAHFSLVDDGMGAVLTSKAQQVDYVTVEFDIPNAVLNKNCHNEKYFNVYIYLFESEGLGAGHTFHKIILPVMVRPFITDTTPDDPPIIRPEDIDELLERIIVVENNYVRTDAAAAPTNVSGGLMTTSIQANVPTVRLNALVDESEVDTHNYGEMPPGYEEALDANRRLTNIENNYVRVEDGPEGGEVPEDEEEGEDEE